MYQPTLHALKRSGELHQLDATILTLFSVALHGLFTRRAINPQEMAFASASIASRGAGGSEQKARGLGVLW